MEVKNLANERIRRMAKGSGVALWMIADYLGVSEPTITRWLRVPLPADKEARIRAAIKEIAGEAFVNV